jgi:hypothetical protein
MNGEESHKGFCQCGCGEKAPIATKTWAKWGWIKGQPKQFINGHASRLPNRKWRRGEDNPQWKGGANKNRPSTRTPGHPRANGRGHVYNHVLEVERVLGKYLPPKAVVHHHTPEQLVACQDQNYHMFLHRRERAFAACGHASWRKCPYCKKYDDPGLMIPIKGRQAAYHQSCKKIYDKMRAK